MSHDLAHSTTYINRDADTPIVAEWLNDVNNAVYKPSLKTTIGGLSLADFSIDTTTPNDRVEFANTNPLDWAAGPGRMTVDFELAINDYFAANPVAHFAVILRCDTAVISTAVRGQGIALGNLVGSGVDLNPGSVLETWMNSVGGAPGDHYIWGSTSQTSRGIGFQDGVSYKFCIEATKTVDDNRYLRYRVWSRQSPDLKWLAECDTGDVLDHNIWADLTNSGLVFAQVFNTDLAPWSLDFTQVKVTWGPADVAAPDQGLKLGRYGADLEGNLLFFGNGRTIRPLTDAGPSLAAWTAFQDQGTNFPTTALAKPNGANTNANFAAVNTSNPDTVYKIVTYGINATEGLIETFHRGSAVPNLGINIGAGTRIATFKASGVELPANITIQPTINAGPSLSAWSGVQSPTLNTPTTLLVKPNGTSVISNFAAVNTANPDTVYRIATFGMSGNEGLIETFHRGAASPDLGINIGAATRVATFSGTGVKLFAAAEFIGPVAIRTIIANSGGVNALALSQANINFEQLSTAGYIASLLTDAGWTAGMKGDVETVTRVLAAVISGIVADLKAKRIL